MSMIIDELTGLFQEECYSVKEHYGHWHVTLNGKSIRAFKGPNAHEKAIGYTLALIEDRLRETIHIQES